MTKYKYHISEFYDRDKDIPEDANAQFIEDLYKRFDREFIKSFDRKIRRGKLFGSFIFTKNSKPVVECFFKKGVIRNMFIFDIREDEECALVGKIEIHNETVDFKKQKDI